MSSMNLVINGLHSNQYSLFKFISFIKSSFSYVLQIIIINWLWEWELQVIGKDNKYSIARYYISDINQCY